MLRSGETIFEITRFQEIPSSYEILRVIGTYERQQMCFSTMETVYYVAARRKDDA